MRLPCAAPSVPRPDTKALGPGLVGAYHDGHEWAVSGRNEGENKPLSLQRLLGDSAALGARMCGIRPAEWQAVVGPRLSERALPESLSEGMLTVRVPSSTWAQELSFLSHVIVERLQHGGHPVTRIRFRVAPQSRRTRPEPPPQRVARAPLPRALIRRLEALDDPELREAIADAAALSLGRQRLQGR